MNIIGVIAEYNPFHNGHLYHLEQIRTIEPDSLIIAVITTTFTQRGTPCYLDKYTKTKLCLDYEIDLVIELPFPFATQSADIFAKGAIQILEFLKVQKIYFGSECNNVEKLISLAKKSLEKNFEKQVLLYLSKGESYPASFAKAFSNQERVNTPNDLLGFSYIREIIKQKSKIIPKTIQRTNNFHEHHIFSTITSATSIRKAIAQKQEFKGTVPDSIYEYLKENGNLEEAYFPFLKYKIISSEDLSIYQTVDEGIENRIKKIISSINSWDEFLQKVKTKRYPYNRIQRMCCHILCNFTKEKAKQFSSIQYIRILGFNQKGRKYLNHIKKEIPVPLISTLSKGTSDMLEYEKQIFLIYLSVFQAQEQQKLKTLEYQAFPIYKKK